MLLRFCAIRTVLLHRRGLGHVLDRGAGGAATRCTRLDPLKWQLRLPVRRPTCLYFANRSNPFRYTLPSCSVQCAER
jgi:hypothetical protein